MEAPIVRFAVVTAIALFSLSCASSGKIVRYNVSCPMAECLYKVSYRGADGIKRTGSVNNWNHQFSSEPGGQFAFTVRRTDMHRRGSLYLHVYIDDHEVMSDRLEPGDAGPITLSGEIE